jgi:cystathionine beta-lyase/cystathionine gamma-synthase
MNKEHLRMKKQMAIDTKLIHAGEPRPLIEGAVSLPIFQSSTYAYAGQGSYHDLKYIRMNNTPNHLALHQKLAALENAETAVVTASGMAAISTALLTLLGPGDHLLVQDCLYGGTLDLIKRDLVPLGITYAVIDVNAPETWAAELTPQTQAVYVETLTNPLLQICDLDAVTAFARANGLVSLIDNTFATPINYRPAEHGFDLSLHSCTKYLNGHSDIVAGAIIGSSAWIEKITHKLNHLGGSLDPHACFLLHRGLKTLAVRMRHHNQSARALAECLQNHPAVTIVNHPGLDSHPGRELANRQLDGFSGMLSFELLGGIPAAEGLMEKLQLPICAPSLGGVETLITRPATTSHAGMTAAERAAAGVTDSLVRVSVGLEDSGDLIADFEQALAGL